MDLIAGLHSEGGRTVLLVTHQLNLVANYAQRIAILRDFGLTLGNNADILKASTLSTLYGMTVHVESVGGRRVVVAS